MNKYTISLIVACCCSLLSLAAQNITIEKLTIEDGLSQGMVFDILQTRDGFLWVGTKDGLNRYDGYHFRSWTSKPYDPYSPTYNGVTALYEDSRGWLWMGSESKGLHIFDRKTDKFYHINIPISTSRGKQAMYDIRQIAEDAEGHIWVVNRGGGVHRLFIPKTWIKKMPDSPDLSGRMAIVSLKLPEPDPKKWQIAEAFQTICMVDANRLLVGSTQYVYDVNIKTMTARRMSLPAPIDEGATSLAISRRGAIWGVNALGVYRLHGNKWSYELSGQIQALELNPLIKIDRYNQVWILAGAQLWKLVDGPAFALATPDYVVDKPGEVLFPDNQDNIWVGTSGYGLRKITPRKAMFNSCLEGQSIWGLWQSKTGETFVKIYNKIYNFNRSTKQLSQQLAFPDAWPQQNDLFFEPSGNIWLLCGLRENNINVAELRRYRPDKSLLAVYPIPLERYPHANLLYTSNGKVWVSGASGQLLRLTPETGTTTTYDIGALFGKDGYSVLVYALVEDANGHIWAGTQMGLVKIVVRGAHVDYKLYRTVLSLERRLSNNSVACLLPDPKAPGKILWIGTKGGGINRLDMTTDSFSYITTAEGLPNDVVYGLLPDEDGNLWCSTNRGLAQLILQNGQLFRIIPYTAGDGLQSSEFNTQAYFKAPDGALYFGGINGMNFFYPKQLKFNSSIPNVFIVGLEINDKPFWEETGIKTPLEYVKTLKLRHDQNHLSFEFSAMDLSDPVKNRYKFQLLPIEKKWVTSHDGHYAHYTHLSPGHYRFRVLGSNSAGIWNEIPTELEIVISPPWWASSIAYLLYILIAGAIVWQFYRSHIQNIQLAARVIYEQRELERVREVEQMKSNFFSNITHEFRTPITLIIEPLRQILSHPAHKNWISKVRLAENNSQKLLYLVNQLLDLAKLESGAMKTEYRLSRLADIVRPVVNSFAAMAQSKGVTLICRDDGDAVLSELDTDKLEKIVANLLSNALKFTPEGGRIEVHCQTVVDPHVQADDPIDGYIRLTVSDTGSGISHEALPRIFDRFFQSADDSGQSLRAGTGIGLALCREFTELMGGSITVESTLGKGAVFNVQIPLRQAVATDPTVDETYFITRAKKADRVEDIAVTKQGGPLVLLAEDNDELRAFLHQTLAAKFDVLTASNGADAVVLAHEQVPDIIVSDLVMPKLDGIGLLDALKQDMVTSHIPVVMLTAKTALEDRLTGLQHGADAYLNKPFHTEELIAWIDNLLESRRRLHEKLAAPRPTDGLPALEGSSQVLSLIDQQFLNRLYDILEEELDNDQLSAEDLARHMALSRSQLHRKLTAMTGQTASELLRNYRLDKAMQMLKAGEGNVSEIAWRVGFVNSKHFSKSFKERFGLPPSEVKLSVSS